MDMKGSILTVDSILALLLALSAVVVSTSYIFQQNQQPIDNIWIKQRSDALTRQIVEKDLARAQNNHLLMGLLNESFGSGYSARISSFRFQNMSPKMVSKRSLGDANGQNLINTRIYSLDSEGGYYLINVGVDDEI